MYHEKKQSIGENAYGQAATGAPGMGMGGMHGGGMPLQQQGSFAAGMNETQAVEVICQWLKEQPENPQGFRQDVVIAGSQHGTGTGTGLPAGGLCIGPSNPLATLGFRSHNSEWAAWAC